MKVSQNMALVPSPIESRRLVIGWSIVIFLSLVELVAVLYGRPSVLAPYPLFTAFVAAVGEWVPVVQSSARCAAHADGGTGLMLALNVCFFPLKLGALYYAHPKKISNPNKGWQGVFGAFYIFLIALVALIPVLIFYVGWGNSPADSSLASTRYKLAALCSGGWRAFGASTLQGSFSLLCGYVSLVIFIGLLRRQPGPVQVGR